MSDSLMGGAAIAPAPAPAPAAAPAAEAAPAEAAAAPAAEVAATIDDGPKMPSWLEGIEGVDSDITLDPSLRAIQDVPSLVKSYVHAQKKMGEKGVHLPTKNSTKEEWDTFYQGMGLPSTLDEGYLQAGEKPVLEETFMNDFKQVAFENRLLPNQAQAMFDFLGAQTSSSSDRLATEQQEGVDKGIADLKTEWGEAFDQNVHKAQVAVAEFGGEELQAYLNESGLGNDPALIRAFSKMGEAFVKEDSFAGEAKPAYALSPAEAEQQANVIMGDTDGPYYNPMHPDHKRVVEEVNKLFQVFAG